MVKLDKLRRFAKGDNRDYVPRSPIWLWLRLRVILERWRRLAKGVNRY